VCTCSSFLPSQPVCKTLLRDESTRSPVQFHAAAMSRGSETETAGEQLSNSWRHLWPCSASPRCGQLANQKLTKLNQLVPPTVFACHQATGCTYLSAQRNCFVCASKSASLCVLQKLLCPLLGTSSSTLRISKVQPLPLYSRPPILDSSIFATPLQLEFRFRQCSR
jgi:hypothetical protein